MAAGRFAPGHLGELTAIVPFELVDAVLSETRTVQRRLRDLPSRVGVYFLLVMCLFPEVGYRLVWDKLTAGLSGIPVVCPTAKALRDCAGDSAARRFGRCSTYWPGRWPGRRRRECGSGPIGRCHSTAAVRRGSPTPIGTGPGWGERLITAIRRWS
ncbi:transposase domain-containing protein [Streptomyces sp. 061-3]|uniref:transposase domain-containing protein n=1 Tax=Streptomyces sp. 061-3 TaxID=2789268 RepID=UPI00397F4C2F